MAALSDSPAARVLAAWRDADLAVRLGQEAITAYDVGRRAGHVRPRGPDLVFEVRRKYLGGARADDVDSDIDGAFAEALPSRLTQIRAHAAAYATQEGAKGGCDPSTNWEPPFGALDRQVQVQVS